MLLRKVVIGGVTALVVAVVLFLAYPTMFTGISFGMVAGSGAVAGALAALVEELLERFL